MRLAMSIARPTALFVATCLVLAALATVATAQGRAPCVGFVRDHEGKALTGAKVVCVLLADQWSGESDRREVTTGADGSFAVELAIGSIYWIWAIGPADEDGRRAVVLPMCDAAAGRTLELEAALRVAPVRLAVSGTAPWLADSGGGPLALRIGVADRIAVGPDLPIPGDGTVLLPPLPSDRFDVGLVNGRGEVMSLCSVDTNISAAVAFPATCAIDVLVNDPRGTAISGAQVLRLDGIDLPPVSGAGLGRRWSPLAAITDEHGRARCLVPIDSRRLFAAASDGRISAISGWFEGRRFENARPTDEDDPDRALAFVLEPAKPATFRVLGMDQHDRPEVRMFDFQLLRIARHSTAVLQEYPALAGAEGRFSCPAPAPSATATAVLRVTRVQPTPHLTHATTAPTEPGQPMPDIDLRTFRTYPIEVVDATGKAVPGARIAAQALGTGTLEPLCEIVTDLHGHAELRLPDVGYSLHVTTPTEYGITLAPAGGGGPLRVVVRPMATMRIRVVDARQRPVSGARIELQGRVEAAGAQPTEASERAMFAAAERNCARFACRCTGPTGELTVRYVAAEGNLRLQLVATSGTSTSDPVRVQLDGAVQVVTLN